MLKPSTSAVRSFNIFQQKALSFPFNRDEIGIVEDFLGAAAR